MLGSRIKNEEAVADAAAFFMIFELSKSLKPMDFCVEGPRGAISVAAY